jgi:hypothetical protein
MHFGYQKEVIRFGFLLLLRFVGGGNYFSDLRFSARLYGRFRGGLGLQQTGEQCIKLLFVHFGHTAILLHSTIACGLAIEKLARM